MLSAIPAFECLNVAPMLVSLFCGSLHIWLAVRAALRSFCHGEKVTVHGCTGKIDTDHCNGTFDVLIDGEVEPLTRVQQHLIRPADGSGKLGLGRIEDIGRNAYDNDRVRHASANFTVLLASCLWLVTLWPILIIGSLVVVYQRTSSSKGTASLVATYILKTARFRMCRSCVHQPIEGQIYRRRLEASPANPLRLRSRARYVSMPVRHDQACRQF